jgi:DNA-3-methyladenine glycosylase II
MPDRLDATTLTRARRTLMRRDPVLAPVIRREGACQLTPTGDPYRSLLQSIVYQQLAGAAAAAIDRRVRAPHRGRYPKPAALLGVPDRELRAAGLSRQKIAAMRAVARAFDEGSLNSRRLYRMSDEAVVEAVTQVRGIGEWTAHMLLMFSLGRPDVLPVGDYGVRVGAWYLWRVVDTKTQGGWS